MYARIIIYKPIQESPNLYFARAPWKSSICYVFPRIVHVDPCFDEYLKVLSLVASQSAYIALTWYLFQSFSVSYQFHIFNKSHRSRSLACVVAFIFF